MSRPEALHGSVERIGTLAAARKWVSSLRLLKALTDPSISSSSSVAMSKKFVFGFELSIKHFYCSAHLDDLEQVDLGSNKILKVCRAQIVLSVCSMYHNIQLRTLTSVRHLSLKMLRIRQLNTMLSVLSFKPSSPTVLPTSCPKVLFPCTYTMLVKNLLPNVRYLVR